MTFIDISKAVPARRRRREGMESPRAKVSPFIERMPASARRHIFIRQSSLFNQRDAAVNTTKMEVDETELTRDIKQRVLDLGAEIVGIAAYDPSIRFSDAEPLDHKSVIVFGMTMAYDYMIDIGLDSQAEVHRVYYEIDDLGVKLSKKIGSYGYAARTHPNISDFPLPAYGQLASLGELGKHGSLISPELESSFHLGAVSTDLPLIADGPRDHKIDEVCASCQICARFCPGDAIKHEKIHQRDRA